MNMFDEARSVRGMMKMCGMTQEEMAKKLGVSQSYIANKLRLLKLEPECEAIITDCSLTERHARALLRLEGKEARLNALKQISDRNLNVAESEALIDLLHDSQAPWRIGKATRISCIDTFKDTLRASLETLSEMGVSATQIISCHGSKTYITLCIDEQ